MLQKLKITTYVFILCLFGLTLITVSPVFAEDSNDAFDACEQMKWKDGKKAKKNCFMDLASNLIAKETEHSTSTTPTKQGSSVKAAVQYCAEVSLHGRGGFIRNGHSDKLGSLTINEACVEIYESGWNGE